MNRWPILLRAVLTLLMLAPLRGWHVLRCRTIEGWQSIWAIILTLAYAAICCLFHPITSWRGRKEFGRILAVYWRAKARRDEWIAAWAKVNN